MSKEKSLNYYPLCLNLKNRNVLVVGAGAVAERKIDSLLEAGASVKVVSTEVSRRIRQLGSKGVVQIRTRPFYPEDLDGMWLVIAATDDADVQKAVYRQATERRIFCNVADQPDLCSFIVPSQVRRGDLCIAISTGGKSPALAKRLRVELEDIFDPFYPEYVSLLGELRELILRSGHNKDTAIDLCRSLADTRIHHWMKNGKWQKIREWAVARYGDGAEKIISHYEGSGST